MTISYKGDSCSDRQISAHPFEVCSDVDKTCKTSSPKNKQEVCVCVLYTLYILIDYLSPFNPTVSRPFLTVRSFTCVNNVHVLNLSNVFVKMNLQGRWNILLKNAFHPGYRVFFKNPTMKNSSGYEPTFFLTVERTFLSFGRNRAKSQVI